MRQNYALERQLFWYLLPLVWMHAMSIEHEYVLQLRFSTTSRSGAEDLRFRSYYLWNWFHSSSSILYENETSTSHSILCDHDCLTHHDSFNSAHVNINVACIEVSGAEYLSFLAVMYRCDAPRKFFHNMKQLGDAGAVGEGEGKGGWL